MAMISVVITGFLRGTCSNCNMQCLQFPQNLRTNNEVIIASIYVLSSPNRLLSEEPCYQRSLL